MNEYLNAINDLLPAINKVLFVAMALVASADYLRAHHTREQLVETHVQVFTREDFESTKGLIAWTATLTDEQVSAAIENPSTGPRKRMATMYEEAMRHGDHERKFELLSMLISHAEVEAAAEARELAERPELATAYLALSQGD